MSLKGKKRERNVKIDWEKGARILLGSLRAVVKGP